MLQTSDTRFIRRTYLSPTADEESWQASPSLSAKVMDSRGDSALPRIRSWFAAPSSTGSTPYLHLLESGFHHEENDSAHMVAFLAKDDYPSFLKELAGRAGAKEPWFEAQEVAQATSSAEDDFVMNVRSSTRQAMGVAGKVFLIMLCTALASPANPSAASSPNRPLTIGSGTTSPRSEITEWEPSPDQVKRTVYGALKHRVESFSKLTDDWDGIGTEAPSEWAVSTALAYLAKLSAADLLPDRIVTSAMGGIGLAFLNSPGVADIEVLNTGEVLVSVVTASRNEVLEITLQDFGKASEMLRDFRS